MAINGLDLACCYSSVLLTYYEGFNKVGAAEWNQKSNSILMYGMLLKVACKS